MNFIYVWFLVKYNIESIKLKLIGGFAPEIHYIGGSDVFPPPLEPDEEAAMVEMLGTDEEDNAKSILIERNLRLVVYIARKFENTGINVEDLISIGTIGLIKAINTFKAEKKIKLSIDEPLNVDWEGNELLLSDILGTDSDIICRGIEDEVDRSLLSKAISHLSKREKKIVSLRFGISGVGEEKTQKEVADMLGISQSYISRLEKRIISRLKKEMMKFT